MSECLFCRIVAGEVPADIVAEGKSWVAVRDIQPQAPVHVLVLSREHVDGFHDLDDSRRELSADLVQAAREIAEREGLSHDGYRVVTNVGRRAGQSVFHLHIHVLGGREMRWPPG